MDAITNNSAKTHYRGNVAAQYDEKRSASYKWKRELETIKDMASRFVPGATILDVPLGTGRFLQSYMHNGNAIVGLDISMDMLLCAKKKNTTDMLHTLVAEAEQLPIRNKSVDYIVCIRLLNWVSPSMLRDILHEYIRVARKGLIVGIRMKKPMRFSNLLRGCVPNTRRITERWNDLIKLTKKPIVEFKQFFLNQISTAAKNNHTDPAGYVLHDEEKVHILLSDLGMEISEEVTIDMQQSILQYNIRPYQIFFLKFKDE